MHEEEKEEANDDNCFWKVERGGNCEPEMKKRRVQIWV